VPRWISPRWVFTEYPDETNRHIRSREQSQGTPRLHDHRCRRGGHEGVHIAPYQFAVGVGAHDPDRARKLLLHSAEIRRFRERIMKDRLTLVPLSIILRDGKVKVELALAQGRTKGDKRQAIAERDVKREIQREISQRNRR
jgi:SsrA-binding protein